GELLHHPRRGREPDLVHLGRLRGERRQIGPGGIAPVEDLTDTGERVDELPRPVAHRYVASVPPEGEPRLPAAAGDREMILIERALLVGAYRWALLELTQGKERLEEAQLVLVDAHRIEGTDIQCPHFHVLHSRSLERLRRPLTGAG